MDKSLITCLSFVIQSTRCVIDSNEEQKMGLARRLDNDLQWRSVIRRLRYKRSIIHGTVHERLKMYRHWASKREYLAVDRE